MQSASNKIYWFDGHCFLPKYLRIRSTNFSIGDVALRLEVEHFNVHILDTEHDVNRMIWTRTVHHYSKETAFELQGIY